MIWTASIQQIDDGGSIGHLPGEDDVVEVRAHTPQELGVAIGDVLARHEQVDCFDLSVVRA